ncbi:cupredoxin domain-containing protein [Paenibacillus daejeonensis]|uniref:cupredoxin domain-containing protein n=1 Tax=Paenibacillus daejeonensis TaxID=135193 RepID=UPI00037216BA|nr:cupredoxin domain-containing protein [Paenibacillus daejeonensis]
MSKVFVVGRKQLKLLGIACLLVVLTGVYLTWNQTQAVSGNPDAERVFHLVTVEYKTTLKDGKELEVYRWDPGSIRVNKGEKVQLRITGVNGQTHPFVIEGLGIKGEVRKGETTVVDFKADRAGTYPILCLTHTAASQLSPMVAYIEVQ